MRLATARVGGRTTWGIVTEDGFVDLAPDHPEMPTLKEVIEQGAMQELALTHHGDSPTDALDELTFEPPIPAPGKIICVGVNFPDRNAEYKDGQEAPPNMSLFPRFADSFTGAGQPLIRPPESHKLDYEGEIAVVIGKPGRRIAETDAYDHIAALTLCNEGTIRDWVRHAKFNVTQGKNWHRSGALGPWLVPFTHAAQLDDVEITTHVNGELRQQDRTSRMLFPIRRQIAYISTFTPLAPGDIIVTGTPTGAGARLDPPQFLKPGDVIEVRATGIGTLTNGVEDE